MRNFLVLSTCLLALPACKRSVCEFGDGSPLAPMTEPWQSNKDLIPPSAKVCGHVNVDGKPVRKDIHIDFENDDNPWVTIVDHLEKKGYERFHQSVNDPESQSASLNKGDDSIRVATFREKGRVHAMLTLENNACRTMAGADGTTCRGNEIVTCDKETQLVSGVKQACAAGTKCVASMSAPAVCK